MLKPNLLFREQWIDNWLDTGVDKPLEDLVRDTDPRYWSITLWVAHVVHRFCDRDYKRSSPDLASFESAQAGKKKVT